MEKIVVTEEKELTTLLKIINETNQIAKNTKMCGEYVLENGEAYSFKTAPEDVGHNVVIPWPRGFIKKTKKMSGDFILNVIHYVTQLNGAMNGKEFYGFFKENKKDIISVEIFNNHFRINTAVPEIFFESKPTGDNSDYAMIDRYRDDHFRLKKTERELSKELIEQVKTSKVPVPVMIDGVLVKLIPKMFLIFKADKYTIEIGVTNKPKLFVVTLTIQNKKFFVTTYLSVIKYDSKLSNIIHI